MHILVRTEKYNAKHIEVSAFTGENINELFELLVQFVRRRRCGLEEEEEIKYAKPAKH